VILAKTIAKPVTLPVITSLGIKKKYMATLMINMASVIVKKLFNVFVFICKTSTFYYAKKSVKKEEHYLNVIKLRDDEPSRYYCLDGIFI